MAITNFRGYPQSVGAKVEAVARVGGVNYTAGTPQTLDARGFGMKYINHISGGMSESETYFVVGKVAGVHGNATTAGIMWFTASSGAEATADLSAEFVVLRVTGEGA